MKIILKKKEVKLLASLLISPKISLKDVDQEISESLLSAVRSYQPADSPLNQQDGRRSKE